MFAICFQYVYFVINAVIAYHANKFDYTVLPMTVRYSVYIFDRQHPLSINLDMLGL